MEVSLSPKSAGAESLKQMIMVTSFGRASPLAPTLFGVTVSESSIKIFINGVLDTVSFMPADFEGMRANEDAVYVRGHPDYLLACQLDFSLGLFEVYQKELSKEDFEVMGQGFSGNAQSTVEPGSVLLGCTDCNISEVCFSI